jgi:PhnB protein
MSPKAVLNPYLTFNGNAAEAMKFYHSILGGELTMQTFGESKMGKTPEEKKRIIHAALNNDALTILASDGMVDRKVKAGDNFSLSITGKDRAWLTDVFDKLAKGGKVDMPLAKQFWGDTFGMVTDRYGIHWMVDIIPQAKGS